MLGKKTIPDRILRWAWSDQELLGAIQVFHFDQAPHFYVQSNREPELNLAGFNVFNFSPFKLAIVGADLRISVDSREWLTYSQRLPTEILMPPYARSGFHFTRQLSDTLVKRLREYPSDWTRIRVQGDMFVKSIFGELRKNIHADVVAIIERK
jgi:hypothetical protein